MGGESHRWEAREPVGGGDKIFYNIEIYYTKAVRHKIHAKTSLLFTKQNTRQTTKIRNVII